MHGLMARKEQEVRHLGRIGILNDVRVVDLSHAVAGPSGSQLLGDLGR